MRCCHAFFYADIDGLRVLLLMPEAKMRVATLISPMLVADSARAQIAR